MRSQLAAHIIPAGIIQFADRLSDAFVVYELAAEPGFSWIIGTVVICVSMIITCIPLVSDIANQDISSVQGLVVLLLAPFNLNVLFYGLIFISAVHSGDEYRSLTLYGRFAIQKLSEAAYHARRVETERMIIHLQVCNAAAH